jgi:prepilin-type processing-associated H-X9-DG protein
MELRYQRRRPEHGPTACKTNERAFSRVDLLTAFFVILFLGAWFGFAHSGERGHILRCARNLEILGAGMQSYANEHNDMLPAADIWLQKASVSWDMKIFPYLHKGVPKADDDQFFTKTARLFFCPSDPARHNGTPRSYAMAANDMSPENWPPGPDSTTGVGVCWDGNTTPPLFGNDAKEHPESLPGVKRSDLPDPAGTLLLTEFIDSQNVLGSVFQTTVQGAVQQQSYFKGDAGNFHHGKFNYLMADGHVELLSPLQTGSPDNHAGIWTIKTGD